MVGRFPGASDLETYWRNIRQGIETVTHFQDERLVKAGVPQGLLSHPAYVKARGVVDDIDMFDPSFFGYSARDAVVMDPQQRLFLQCCWEGLETAGYDPRAYQGLIGVYGGATASSYQNMVWASLEALKVDGMSAAIGNELPFLTTRVSYKLDLKGPSCPVQTACSTSLVAVHLACQGLLNAECDMALAGGVSFRVPQEAGYVYQEEGILSPDGRCRPFDATANGTLFSNGLGVVVLKRLEDALADGDTIYAVIRGSAINNDGARKASFTAPGVVGQSQVIADALASAQVDPETISYIETHGTATALGDSIEIQALTKAFATSAARILRPRIGESEHRSSRRRRGRRRADQDRPRAAPQADAADGALHAAEPRHQLRRDALLRERLAQGMDAGGRRRCAGPASARSGSAAPTRTWCSKRRRRSTRQDHRASGSC